MIIELAQALRIKYKQQAVQVHLNMGGKPNARIIEPVIVEEGDTFDSIKMAIEKMKKYRAECDAKREQESEQWLERGTVFLDGRLWMVDVIYDKFLS